jgi:hypothetical protein
MIITNIWKKNMFQTTNQIFPESLYSKVDGSPQGDAPQLAVC